MFRSEFQQCVKIAAPYIVVLAGESVYQVKADVADAAVTEDADGTASLLGGVAASYIGEYLMIESLYAHTDAVKASKRMMDSAGVVYRQMKPEKTEIRLSLREQDV